MEQNELILAKSAELFKRYGIRSVTMDEIAVQCGMSKKTVYQHYTDKDTLVNAIMESHIAQAESHCRSSQAESENAIHEVFLSLDWVHEMFDGVNPALLFDLRKYHSTVFQKLEEHKRHFMAGIIRQNTERGIAEGLYREDLILDILVPMRLMGMTLVFEHDIFPRNRFTLFEINQELTLYELYGMATPKGYKLIDKYRQQRSKLHTS